MMRSVKPWRLAAMMLGILAVFGLLLRAQAAPVPSMDAPFYGTLCHGGDTDRRAPARSAPACNGCVLCQAVQSDYGGTPILPVRFVLRAPPDRIERPLNWLAAKLTHALWHEGFRARAPPASA